MNEIWKDIEGYNWIYQISSLWKVKSFYKWKDKIILWTRFDKVYRMFHLYLDKKRNPMLAHRIVAINFIDNPNNLPLACHKIETLDENWFLYNWVDNLFWWTYKDNNQDKHRKWRANSFFTRNPPNPNKWKFGKNHPRSKKINQYTREWTFIREWENAYCINRELWIHTWSISDCCNWKKKTVWNFVWKFL